MNKTIKITIIVILQIVAVISIWTRESTSDSTPIVFVKDHAVIHTAHGQWPISIEVARTEREQEHGLMFRKSLPKNYGMLFLWDEDIVIGMWMKNTLVPLDMLFIDTHGRIINIARNAKPNSTDNITAGAPVRGVLEIEAGMADAHHIAIGDTITHPHFKP